MKFGAQNIQTFVFKSFYIKILKFSTVDSVAKVLMDCLNYPAPNALIDVQTDVDWSETGVDWYKTTCCVGVYN